jgi:hypothetical protein
MKCSFYEVLYLIHSSAFRLRPPGRKTPPIRKQTKVQMPRSVNMEKVVISLSLEVSSIPFQELSLLMYGTCCLYGAGSNEFDAGKYISRAIESGEP